MSQVSRVRVKEHWLEEARDDVLHFTWIMLTIEQMMALLVEFDQVGDLEDFDTVERERFMDRLATKLIGRPWPTRNERDQSAVIAQIRLAAHHAGYVLA